MIEIQAASRPIVLRRIYHGCSRCNDILERSQWLLEFKDWKLQKLGSGGNGEVYIARCPETGCEHAAKFLPYPNGKWECDVTERVQKTASRHIVKAICSGMSRHPAGGASDSVPKIVLLLELMSEDLFEAVFAPSPISGRMLYKNCALKHVAYQLLEAVRATHEVGVIHEDVKMENLMVRYLPGCGILKLGDFGNAILKDGDRRIGGTFAYTAPENVIGLRNKGCLGDVFSSAIVLMEIVCRATLMPESLLSAYKDHARDRMSTVVMSRVQLYHLVILSSLIAQRPVYTGYVVRRYFGSISKHRIIDMLKSHFPSFEEGLYSIIAKVRWVEQTSPEFFRFAQVLLTRIEQRPSAQKAMEHAWFANW